MHIKVSQYCHLWQFSHFMVLSHSQFNHFMVLSHLVVQSFHGVFTFSGQLFHSIVTFRYVTFHWLFSVSGLLGLWSPMLAGFLGHLRCWRNLEAAPCRLDIIYFVRGCWFLGDEFLLSFIIFCVCVTPFHPCIWAGPPCVVPLTPPDHNFHCREGRNEDCETGWH